jgi:uncharacterized membrane protein
MAISVILRSGVIVSVLLVAFGTTLSFVRHREYLTQPAQLQRLTRPGASFPHTLSQTVDGLKRMRGQAFVVLGLLLLIATPVLRVAVSIFAFLAMRDRNFAWITAIVLLLLLLSFLLGAVER